MCTEIQDESHDGAPRDLSDSWTQVAALVSAIDTTLGKWLTDTYNIGLTEYRATLHLSRAVDHELRITELAHKVGLNLSSTTRLVGRMELKKLAIRDTCPDDGRGVYAVVTDHGLHAITEIHEAYEAHIHALLLRATSQHPQLDLRGLSTSLRTVNELISSGSNSGE